MSKFEDKYNKMIALELAKSQGDIDRKAELIELMARSLGLVISVCTDGNPLAIDEIATGIEAFIHSKAVEKAPFARIMANR